MQALKKEMHLLHVAQTYTLLDVASNALHQGCTTDDGTTVHPSGRCMHSKQGHVAVRRCPAWNMVNKGIQPIRVTNVSAAPLGVMAHAYHHLLHNARKHQQGLGITPVTTGHNSINSINSHSKTECLIHHC